MNAYQIRMIKSLIDFVHAWFSVSNFWRNTKSCESLQSTLCSCNARSLTHRRNWRNYTRYKNGFWQILLKLGYLKNYNYVWRIYDAISDFQCILWIIFQLGRWVSK